jgi:3-oxoacyl-[acyl-carrier protein] reductase
MGDPDNATFRNKAVLVTGAAGSIGRGIAHRFCELGASVFITDLHQDRLAEVAGELSSLGRPCGFLAGDVTDRGRDGRADRRARERRGHGGSGTRGGHRAG